jgi:hypothetical protein
VDRKALKLLSKTSQVVATGQVTEANGFFEGTIDFADMPDDLRALFEEFDEVVNGQMLSLVDEVQDKIGSLGLRVVLDNGVEVPVRDLQIYPSSGDVSFRLVEAAANGPLNVGRK